MRLNREQAIVGAVSLVILATSSKRALQMVAFVVLAVVVAIGCIRRRYNCFRVHLVSSDSVNETLLLECRLAGNDTLFMIDTGYAGPPVLSASFLAVTDPVYETIETRYRLITKRLDDGVSADRQHQAIDDFIARSRCLAYTSGCTMRLMGIGATQEQQADMLMCDMLELKTARGFYARPKRETSEAQADVFVTNPLPTSIHIVTCDFLLHSSPALLAISKRELHLNMSANEELLERSRMVIHPVVLSGGSFVVDVLVGDVTFACTVDTGAPGPICLSVSAGAKLKRCIRDSESHSLRQSGVNGEQVCSEIIAADITFCERDFKSVPIFINDTTIEQVDGYIGMGFLRAFDMLFTTSGIGFGVNGIPMRDIDAFKESAVRGACAAVKLQCHS